MTSTDEICISVEGHLFKFTIKDLCEASAYFQSMLNGNFCESQKDCIKLEEIDAKLFTIIHKWINSKEIDITTLSNDDLLQFICNADRFFITEMLSFCNEEALRRLNLSSVPEEFDENPNDNKVSSYFVQFFETAVFMENNELKETFAQWLLNSSLNLHPNEAYYMDQLMEKTEQIEGFIESEQFKKIEKYLTKSACDVMKRIVKQQANNLMIEKQNLLKKLTSSLNKFHEELEKLRKESMLAELQLEEQFRRN